MLYYANPVSPATITAMGAGLLGMIDTPYQAKRPSVLRAHAAGARWCADNGAFNDRWEADYWWGWLQEQLPYAASCDFAVTPDVVGDPAATDRLAAVWLDRIRALGLRPAYVLQDGIERTGPPWADLSVLFIGGSTAWKLGPAARALTAEANERGVPVHMGRVNSLRRYTYARTTGCSSVDGTYLTFGPDRRLPDLLSWVRSNDQPALF